MIEKYDPYWQNEMWHTALDKEEDDETRAFFDMLFAKACTDVQKTILNMGDVELLDLIDKSGLNKDQSSSSIMNGQNVRAYYDVQTLRTKAKQGILPSKDCMKLYKALQNGE